MEERRPLQFNLLSLFLAVSAAGVFFGMIRAFEVPGALALAMLVMLIVFPVVGTVSVAKNYQRVGTAGERWMARFDVLILLGFSLFGVFLISHIVLMIAKAIRG